MIKYISKWYQGIIKTPRPDIEEASQAVYKAVDELNKAVNHLESIEGVYGAIQDDNDPGHTRIIFGGKYTRTKFKLKVGYIAESHRREF